MNRVMRMIWIYFLLLILFLALPEVCVCSARSALQIWSMDVVPSLFPYMVICRLISFRLRQQGVSASFVVPLLGLLGGSPAGAAALAGYAGSISKGEMHTLCALTGTISPMFFLGVLSRWLGDSHLGQLLLIAHWSGSSICCACVFLFEQKFDEESPIIETHQLSGNADFLRQSIDAILMVGGNIVLFSVIAGLISSLSFIPADVNAAVHAMMEVAGGIHELAALALRPIQRACILAAVSGFGGLSILFQNYSFLGLCGVKLSTLLGYGVIRAAASTVVIWILLT